MPPRNGDEPGVTLDGGPGEVLRAEEGDLAAGFDVLGEAGGLAFQPMGGGGGTPAGGGPLAGGGALAGDFDG